MTEALALNKWDILDQVWVPHEGQAEVVSSNARHRVLSAGRRFGKSTIGGMELVPEAFATFTQRNELLLGQKRREFWVVGPEYTDSEKEFRVVYNQLKALEMPFDRPGTYNDPLNGNLHISLWKGTFQIHGKSAKYPDSLVGEGLNGVILAEAAKLKPKIWTKYVRPMLADFNGWSIHSSTPEGKNHFYEHWQRGQNPRYRNWDSWRMPSWRNPHVYRMPTRERDVKLLFEMMKINTHRAPEELIERYKLQIDDEILALMMDLTEEAFKQEIGADFTEFVGRVFKAFDEEIHVTDLSFIPGWDTVAAVDYGFTNPNVWLLIQIGPFNEVHVLDEIYQPGLSPEEFAEEIKYRNLCPSNLRTFYPDPASPGDTRVLQNKLRIRPSANTGGELKHRLDAIRKALKRYPSHLADGHPEKRPQILFDRKCKNTIDDMNNYRYPEKRDQSSTPGQELPMKKDDHGPEALGRFFRGHFGTADRQATRGNRRTKINAGKPIGPNTRKQASKIHGIMTMPPSERRR